MPDLTEYRLHGPPGTGKTTSLATRWIPRAAERFGANRILVCSLTRAAAAEIASRDSGIPHTHVGTLHAHCYRALGRPEIALSAAGIRSWNEWAGERDAWGYRLSSGSAASRGIDAMDGVPDAQTPGDSILASVDLLRSRMVARDLWPDDCKRFGGMWHEWQEESGYRDFTGLIEDALEMGAAAPYDPEVLIVDEAQDSSALELALLRHWASEASYLVTSGDADQSIYRFRGGSPGSFLAPIPEDHNYSLTQSWRLPRAVHARAVAWIRETQGERYDVAFAPRDEEGAWLRSPGNYGDTGLIARALRDETADGSTSMVLTTCGYMLYPLLQELQRRGIPYGNPYADHGGWNPLRYGAEPLTAFLKPLYGRAWSWRDLGLWLGPLRVQGLLQRGESKRIKARAKEKLAEEARVPPNVVLELFERDELELLTAAFKGGRGVALDWFDRNRAKRQKSMDFCLRVARTDPAALQRAPRVVIGTIHSVKGGQADRVHLFPDLSQAGDKAWRGGPEVRDEVRRAFYVGMTRAKASVRTYRPVRPDRAVVLPA